MSSSLIDTGANLTHDSFDRDRAEVIARARAAGVTTMLVTGSDINASHAALTLCGEYPGTLYCTAGVHPHHAQAFDTDTPSALHGLLARPEVLAVGECGLDYFRNFSPPDAQRTAFEAQLALACETGKPAFLHQRDAHQDFVAIVRPCRDHLVAGVVHCFTGSEMELRDYLELGLYIGITGWICDERRGMHLRELVKRVPADRLMLETDAPYLFPRDIKPRPAHHRNEPMYLAHICKVVATCTGKAAARIAEETSANAQRFFNLPTAHPVR